MTVKDLTDKQLERLDWRLYCRATAGDHWGADWRTLKLTSPGLAAALMAVRRELELRNV